MLHGFELTHANPGLCLMRAKSFETLHSKDTLVADYSPSSVLLSLLTKSHDPPSRASDQL